MYIYIYIIYVRCATSRKRHHGEARSVVATAGDLPGRERLARQWDDAAPCPGDDQWRPVTTSDQPVKNGVSMGKPWENHRKMVV